MGKKIDIEKIENDDAKSNDDSYCNKFHVQIQVTAITSCMEVLNALSNKEQGRKFMLMDKFNDGHKNMMNVLTLIQNKEKYKKKLRIDGRLSEYIDNYFRKLIQQKQDNEEQKIIEDKEAEERKKKEEKERLEKLRK